MFQNTHDRSQEVELTIKAKKELETLRSRFKMMHTAGSLARSPSSSESELPIGVRFKNNFGHESSIHFKDDVFLRDPLLVSRERYLC